MTDRDLTTAELKVALGVPTVEQVDRWCERWGLEPISPKGRRPRRYAVVDFLAAVKREDDTAREEVARTTAV